MGKRLVASQNDINTAHNTLGNWLRLAGPNGDFKSDFQTMKWIDLKKKYQIKQSQKNFEGLVRKTYRTLELSTNKQDNSWSLEIRSAYSGKAYQKPIQNTKRRMVQKYPYSFVERDGKNQAYCNINHQLTNYSKVNVENYNLDVKYAQPDSATMLFNAFLKYRLYVGNDITLKSIANRFTIIVITSMFNTSFSSNRQKYTHADDIWNEIEDKLMELIVDVNSISFEGLEITIEGVL